MRQDRSAGLEDCLLRPSKRLKESVIWDHTLIVMERVSAVIYCVGLFSLLLLQGALHIEGRSILSPESNFFNTNGDMDAQSKILALLLHKSMASAGKEDPLAMALANRLAELEELRSFKNGLEDREAMIKLGQERPLNKKRAEPCFWKYCV